MYLLFVFVIPIYFPCCQFSLPWTFLSSFVFSHLPFPLTCCFRFVVTKDPETEVNGMVSKNQGPIEPSRMDFMAVQFF